MIPGLPLSASIHQILPKKALYEKFCLTNQEKAKFDRSVHKMTIVAEISPKTVNIASGKDVRRFYIIEVELQSKKYDRKSIESIFRLIEQDIVLVLISKRQYRLAVFKGVLLESDWMELDMLTINLVGLDLDVVWENIVKRIGNINVTGENTLEEQISKDLEQRKLQQQIDSLDRKMRVEKQPRAKREMYEELQALKDRIE
ncbi:MAG: DUF4391 domain-containing protein [Candidatus Methanomethylophilus sp.]|nr:DUF4391 domain-containing protein [Methanomethylophilus sp.]